MDARQRLVNVLWDNYTPNQKNEMIDAYAHALAERQRAMVADRPTGDLMRMFFREAANVIDPEVTP